MFQAKAINIDDKAAFYEQRGLRVVCPTNRAIDEMITAVEPARATTAGGA